MKIGDKVEVKYFKVEGNVKKIKRRVVIVKVNKDTLRLPKEWVKVIK